MSKKEAVLIVTRGAGARVDVGEDGTVQVSAFKAEGSGEFGGFLAEWGMGNCLDRWDTRPGCDMVERPLTLRPQQTT